MAKVKYRLREYKPNANMPGTHGFYAEVVISTDIDARKSMIEDLEQGIENKDTIKNAVMFVSAAYEIRVAMTNEAAVDVMQVVLEKYKQELVELEKQFEEL